MPFDPSAVRSGATFSTNPTYQAAWVCYVNGIEVPIIGFDIQCGVWQPPAFTIHMIPDIVLQRLGSEDRVPVQIFYLDYWVDAERPEFRLLVDGEITGWSYSSSIGQRTMAFRCVSHIHVFQQLYFFYMTNVDSVVAAQSPEVLSSSFTSPVLLYPYSLFHQGLLVTNNQVAATRAQPRRPGQPGQATPVPMDDPDANLDPNSPAQPIKAPYELVYNVIKGVISSEVPNSRHAVPMMNFFARHIRKTRLQNRFVRLPFLEDPEALGEEKGVFPIFKAARNAEALNAMQRQVSAQTGESGPVWNMLQQILSMVYMEIAMIPNPAAVLVELNTATAGPRQDGKIIGVLNNSSPVQTTPTPSASGVAPVIVAGSAQDSRSALEILRGTAPSSVFAGSAQDTRTALQILQGTTPSSPTVTPSAAPAAPAPAATTGTPASTLAEGAAPSSPAFQGINPQTPIRLAQYFVKPQFLFAVPPHCNVIFPSMIDAWTYDEPYLTQPTRVYVNDSVMTQALRANGPNRHFILHALTVAFPEEADALMRHKAGGDTNTTTTQATAGNLESGKNLLIWPEEYYKGPVTEKLDLPPWFQMLRQFANSQPANGETGAAAPGAPTPGAGRPTTGTNAPAVPAPLVPGTAVATPPSVSEARRGTPFSRQEAQENFAYRWRMTPETQRIGDTKNNVWVRARDKSATFGELGDPINGRWQWEPGDALKVLAAHLIERFPNAFDHAEYRRPFARQPAAPKPPAQPVGDMHIQGRAIDMICKRKVNPPGTRLRGMPDLENVSPVAEYLVQNADVFGVLLVVWARSEWDARGAPGRRYAHYTNAPEKESMDHFDHIHIDLNLPASRGELPFYQNNRHLFPVRQRRLPRRNGQEPVAPTGPRPLPVLRPPRRPGGSLTTPTRPATAPAPGTAQDAAGRTVASQPAYTPGTPAPAQNTPASPVPATQAPTAVDAETLERSADSFQQLFRLYAQYEFLRRRYTQRQAAVQMKFNPYVVPGFPSMLFDSMRTRFHMVGYIQSVSHSASAAGGGNISTSVQMTCCRTLPEFINDVRADAERFRSRVTAAPAEIIDQIRERMQDEDNAEAFYRRLFYGNGPRAGDAPTAFRWTEAMGYSRGLLTEDIYVRGESVAVTTARAQTVQNEEQNEVAATTAPGNTAAPTPAAAPANTAIRLQQAAANAGGILNSTLPGNPAPASATINFDVNAPSTTAPQQSTSGNSPAQQANRQRVEHNLDPNVELSPRENIYQDAFDRYDIAMQLASRPACTLEQYIRFWHGGAEVGALVDQQIVTGPQDAFAYIEVKQNEVIKSVVGVNGSAEYLRGMVSHKVALYYDRIFKLRPGPGTGADRLTGPTEAERGYTDPPSVRPSTQHSGVAADYPQTRADWDSILITYRNKVRTLLRPTV